MGKIRSFLGFFGSLVVMFFTANAVADYSCLQNMVYTECKHGYYWDADQCLPCSGAKYDWVTQIQDETELLGKNNEQIGITYRFCPSGNYFLKGAENKSGSKDDGRTTGERILEYCTGCVHAGTTIDDTEYICECNDGYEVVWPNNDKKQPCKCQLKCLDGFTLSGDGLSCSRACTTGDVNDTNATAVSGTLVQGEPNACTITACKAGYEISADKRSCQLKCDAGYTPTDWKGTTVCARSCTTADIANTTQVSGMVAKNGENTCSVLACANGYRPTSDSKSCEKACNTAKACSDLNPTYTGTYNECTGNQATACYMTCSVQCTGQDLACPANATCNYDTGATQTGKQYYGSNECKNDSGTTIVASTCKRMSVTCNAGYRLVDGECVGLNYTVTYQNGGGQGDPTMVWQQFGGSFTTKPANTFTRPGYSFNQWKDGDNNTYLANATSTYQTPKNITLTAQWDVCPASSVDGQCNCPAGERPNGVNGCSSCTIQCTDSEFSQGSYNECSGQTNAMCYRACTTADFPGVDNINQVSGTLTKGGTNTCRITACTAGYEPAADGKSCTPKKYTVYYQYNGETKTQEVTYGTKYTTFDGNTFKKPGSSYSLWDCPQCNTKRLITNHEYTYNYTKDLIVTPQWQACASSELGACNCGADQYPDGNGGCQGWTACGDTFPDYPNGQYNNSTGNSDDNENLACYRDCVVDDLATKANAKTVSGVVHKGGSATCTITECNTGYTPSANGTSCVGNMYTLTYKPGTGGIGDPIEEQIQRDAEFTVKRISETGFYKPGYQFTSWKLPILWMAFSSGAQISYAKSQDVTATAQWAVCEYNPDAYSLSNPDNCNCGDNKYPDGNGGCGNCVIQCNNEDYILPDGETHLSNKVGDFTSGSFNVCQAEGYAKCYRECRVEDLDKAKNKTVAAVTGTIDQTGTGDNCKVLECKTGYSPSADMRSCVPDTYTITYIPNASDAYRNPDPELSALSLVYDVQYDKDFTLLPRAVFLRPGWSYSNWKYEGSDSTLAAGSEKTFKSTTNKNIVPNWVKCTSNSLAPGTCACAADEYPNGNGACSSCITQCVDWNSKYPIGTYNACSDNSEDSPFYHCASACTHQDIDNAYVNNSGEASGVTGLVYANGEKECEVYKCQPGYVPSSDNKSCQKATFTLRYDPNGGTGSVLSNSVKYTEQFTTLSAVSSWTNPGKRFKGWSEPFPKPNTIYSYGRTEDTTLFAQWENCPASSVAGECGCLAAQRPDGNGSCTSCTVACSTIAGTEYPLGNYDQCKDNSSILCKRACTVSDIPHAVEVEGNAAASSLIGTRNCKVIQCEDGYRPKSDGSSCVLVTSRLCGDGYYHNGTDCTPCPDGFDKTDGLGTSASQCYKESTTTCRNPGKGNGCPENAYTCTYKASDSTQVPCRIYNDGSNTCTPIGNDQCPYATITCNGSYYATSTECISCADLGDLWAEKSTGGKGPNACYSTCDYQCVNDLDTLKPEHAESCQLVSNVISGRIQYPSTNCQLLSNRSCAINSCTCETGYTYREPTGTTGDNGECVANVYTITLNDNGGNGGSGTVYQKYNTGWSLTNFGSTVNSITVPTWENHTFRGYYNTATPDANAVPVIPVSGVLPANTTFTADTQLFAQWTEDLFYCTAGKTASGASCPTGSYCPGEAVPANQKNNTTSGCQRTCPVDAAGGTVTSAGGSQALSACKSTRTIANDDSKHGSADETCSYGTNAYDGACSIKMTACYAGYYRAEETSTSCTLTEVGNYSAAGNLDSYACSDLSGADSTVTTAGRGAKSPMECYNVCAVKTIDNGSRKPVEEEVHYNETTIPACTFETKCDTGYHANGEVCSADIYTITLTNGTDATPKTSTIYLKYADGWYSDAAATKRITKVDLPTKSGGFTCYGYIANNIQVVDETGTLTTNYTMFTDNATANASWEQNESVVCKSGEYYAGTGTTCTACAPGDYCEGVTTFKDINQEVGRKSCADLKGTYVAATDAAGNTMTVTITSPASAKSSAECYATNVAYAPASNLGSGRQTCKYNASTGKYANECSAKELFTCVAGHWRQNTSDIDCVPVGSGYYSPATVMTRKACPNLGEVQGITSNDTAEDITKCKLGNIWYEPTGGHSGHRRACYHKPDETATDVSDYSYNCDASKLVTCDAGYYYDGSHTIVADGDTVPDCIPVTDGWYSPAPTSQPNFEDTVLPSIKRTQCPNGGKTGKNNASLDTECYQICADKVITNGNAVVPAGKEKAYYTGSEYPACVYNAQCDSGFAPGSTTPTANPVCGGCPENSYCTSDGQTHACPAAFPKSDPGATTAGDCYKDCVATGNITSVSGREYSSGTKTCTVTGCNVGTHLTGGKCETCPAGHTCQGGTDEPQPCPAGYYCTSNNPNPQQCPTEYPQSAAGTADIGNCYRDCTPSDVSNATEVQGIKKQNGTGNTCAATACRSGAYLTGGQCKECQAGYICSSDGKTECPAGSFCPTGATAPTKCPASHPNSAPGASKQADCYKTCESYEIQGGTAVPKSDKAQYNTQCVFEGRSESGNPCTIVNNVCTEMSCNSDYELIDGRCQKCVRENVLSYKATGNCIPASCVTGYHPNGLVCEKDVKECEMPHATSAEQRWNTKLGAFGICTISECDDGYHMASNTCVEDEQACVVDHGTGIQEWNHASNKWGACVATSCDPGYTDDPSETNERNKPCGQCKNKFSVLGEQAASSYIRGCEIASCMYQGEMYNLENNECVPICEVNGYEDETGIRKWDASRKKCVRTCKEGYTMW